MNGIEIFQVTEENRDELRAAFEQSTGVDTFHMGIFAGATVAIAVKNFLGRKVVMVLKLERSSLGHDLSGTFDVYVPDNHGNHTRTTLAQTENALSFIHKVEADNIAQRYERAEEMHNEHVQSFWLECIEQIKAELGS